MVLADIPIEPGVTSHSIIAIKGDGDPMEGDDGVVEYKSAHLDGVASEFIVRSEHSCQENPFTIEEVRRILLEHLKSQAFLKNQEMTDYAVYVPLKFRDGYWQN